MGAPIDSHRRGNLFAAMRRNAGPCEATDLRCDLLGQTFGLL